MRREVKFIPAFDRRDSNPSKNYGIGSVRCIMVLIDDENEKAAHFSFSTGMYLESVITEYHRKGIDLFHYSYSDINGQQSYYMGYDVGYHDTKKHYQGQIKRKEICDYIGKRCYSDGSTLLAETYMDVLVKQGSDKIWEMLEDYMKEI